MKISRTEEIAAFASLSMTLEATSYPKPGNVHRMKDFEETSLEHFLASAISAHSVFEKAVSSSSSIGSLFHEAVFKSNSIQSGGNTHFGTFILLIPLAKAAGIIQNRESRRENNLIGKEIIEKAFEICKQTTPKDATDFYEAFNLLSVSVEKKEMPDSDFEFDLTNPGAVEAIQRTGTTLFDLMERGSKRDMIAAEWVNGFEKSYLFSKKLQKNKEWFEKNPKKCFKSQINSAITLTFLEFMAMFPDTFISTKFDVKTAEKVRKKADRILKQKSNKNLKKMIPKIKKLDKKLQKSKINPGSLADIAAAGIFIAFLEGMKI